MSLRGQLAGLVVSAKWGLNEREVGHALCGLRGVQN